MSKYRKVNDCFEKCDTIRAAHLLFEDFLQERTDITKFIFYLWLQRNELQAERGKDEKGYFGYGLRYIPKEEICYKTNDTCKYDCKGLCRESY